MLPVVLFFEFLDGEGTFVGPAHINEVEEVFDLQTDVDVLHGALHRAFVGIAFARALELDGGEVEVSADTGADHAVEYFGSGFIGDGKNGNLDAVLVHEGFELGEREYRDASIPIDFVPIHVEAGNDAYAFFLEGLIVEQRASDATAAYDDHVMPILLAEHPREFGNECVYVVTAALVARYLNGGEVLANYRRRNTDGVPEIV
jgi:hypothetical protein